MQNAEPLIFGLKKMVIQECNVKDLSPSQIGNDDIVIGGEGNLKLDSLDAVEIVTSLERNFTIRLDNMGESRKVFKSFNAMAEYVIVHAPPERLDIFVQKFGAN